MFTYTHLSRLSPNLDCEDRAGEGRREEASDWQKIERERRDEVYRAGSDVVLFCLEIIIGKVGI